MPEVLIGFPRASSSSVIQPTTPRCFAVTSPGSPPGGPASMARAAAVFMPTGRMTAAAPRRPFRRRRRRETRRQGGPEAESQPMAVQKDARVGGWAEEEHPDHLADGELPGRKTRVIDGACIFLNRPGFPAGQGARCTCSPSARAAISWKPSPTSGSCRSAASSVR